MLHLPMTKPLTVACAALAVFCASLRAADLWVADPWFAITAASTAPANAPQIMHLTAARGGMASGMVVVADKAPIQSLTPVVSPFTGPKPLAASAVRVRFPTRERDLGPGPDRLTPKDWFDGLSPKLIPGETVQPVLVTVDVPADTTPGLYQANLTVAGKTTPIQLHVGAFTVPTPAQRQLYVELQQSPESLALRYNVPLWSDAHFTLIEQSLQQVARLGGNIMQIPVVTRTRLGYTTGLITFTRKGTELVPDFTNFERYLALWIKTCGQPRFVILSVWDIGMAIDKKKTDPDTQTVGVSVKDGAGWVTVQLPNPELGQGDQPWRDVVLGAQARVIKAGLAQHQMLIGQQSDAKAGPVTTAMYQKIDPLLRWSVWTHGYGYRSGKDGMESEHGAKVGLARGPDIGPGAEQKGLGRGYPQPTEGLVRINSLRCFIGENQSVNILWRMSPDLSFGGEHQGGSNGYGPIGLDFLSYLKPQPAAGNRDEMERWKRNPWHNQWGGPFPNLQYCRLDRGQPGQITIAGPQGVLPTLRSEALAEGAIEAEARIALEVNWRKNPEAIALAKSRYVDLGKIATNNGLKDPAT
ncbi:MAG: glycoside hydrolase domain-containing protein, partial [Phycisphaerae bacterium]